MGNDPNLDLYFLSRNVQFRYALDQYEDDQLAVMLKAYNGARRSIMKKIGQISAGQEEVTLSEARTLALLDETYKMTGGIRQHLSEGIGNLAQTAGFLALHEHQDILSLGQRLPIRNVSLTPEQMRSIVVDTPIGGRNLAGWVDETFDYQLKTRIQTEIARGMILGEGYPAITRRLENGLNLARTDAITLARTYVQNINTSAQESVYKANTDIVNAVKWCAVMETGNISTGTGTCLRCAALDGEVYGIDEDHPPIPLHPRCRCSLLPVTKSFRELGIPLNEIEEATRPYAKYPPENIDAGGRRTIEEVGFHKGDYASWFSGQDEEFQKNVLGPGRLKLVDEGKVDFKGLVDRSDGRLKPIKELTGEIPPPTRAPAPSGPIESSGGAVAKPDLEKGEKNLYIRSEKGLSFVAYKGMGTPQYAEATKEADALLEARNRPTLENEFAVVKEKAADMLEQGLHPEEIGTIRAYTGDIFAAVNSQLRGQPGAVPDEQVEGVYAFSALATQGLMKLPGYEGTVYRGADLPLEVVERFMAAADATDPEKKMVMEEGFTSTSYESNAALKKKHTMVIESKGGAKKIDSISKRPEQMEALFIPGTKFYVSTATELKDGEIVFYMGEVEK
jgi:SPP1 gp7 family putative phage head morphogenesis protein